MKAALEFKPVDLWVGVRWTRKPDGLHLFLCLIPMFPVHLVFTRRSAADACPHYWEWMCTECGINKPRMRTVDAERSMNTREVEIGRLRRNLKINLERPEDDLPGMPE